MTEFILVSYEIPLIIFSFGSKRWMIGILLSYLLQTPRYRNGFPGTHTSCFNPYFNSATGT